MVFEATKQLASTTIDTKSVPQIQPTESFSNLLEAVRATSNKPLLSENSLNAASDKSSTDARELNFASPANPPRSVAGQKNGEKPLRRSDLPTEKKMTPEEQSSTAKEIAIEIAEKGLTASPELRDKIRGSMLRVYMDGDKNGPGNEKAMYEFVEQISKQLDKGMSLQVDASEANKEFTDFRKKAQDTIASKAGMKMGACGQLRLIQTIEDRIVTVEKMHYAASIVKDPPMKMFG